jgi:hypothetical protein
MPRRNKKLLIDIPGAFLHANKDYVVMKMNGSLAELMVKTDPKIHIESTYQLKWGDRFYTYACKKHCMA